MMQLSPINQTTLRILYYRNKQFIVPVIIFAVCIVIIFEAIIPQIQDWISIRNQVSTKIQKIDQLNSDIAKISVVNENNLDSQIAFLSQVLPQDKDYIGILNAISQAAILSGTSLGDYSFNVGDLASSDIKNDTIQLKLNIAGSVAEARKFIDVLKNQAPLSDIADITIANNIVTIVSVFYFKPFPNIIFDENSGPLSTITSKEEKQLQKLQGTINTSSGSTIVTP